MLLSIQRVAGLLVCTTALACATAGAPADGGLSGDAGSGAGPDASINPATDAGQCSGDSQAWDAILAHPLTCTKNSDCCVIINTCLYEAQVVTESDFAADAGALWPTCVNQCTHCVAPDVAVGCSNGTCTAVTAPTDAGVMGSQESHCGDDSIAVPAGETHLGCGG